MRQIVNILYRLAGFLYDLEVIASGSPRRIAKRLRNKAAYGLLRQILR